MKKRDFSQALQARYAGVFSSAKSKPLPLVILAVGFISFCIIIMALVSAPQADAATDERPSVLLVDSSTGDLDLFKLHWLGETISAVAEQSTLQLLTAEQPVWWQVPTAKNTVTAGSSNTAAPATFLLGDTAHTPLTAEQIVWALDQIAASGAQPKTVIVSLGASGLQARRYVEDLASPLQSARADIVGLVLLGTPNQGYSTLTRYPDLKLWDALAAGANLTSVDLTPESAFLTELNAAPLPHIVKTLQVRGTAEDLGFGATDGAAVEADVVLPQTVSTQIASMTTRATISQALGLTDLWMPATTKEAQQTNAVQEKAVQRLSALDSYVTAPEVQDSISEFYQAWFNQAAPVTHISSVLTIDLSGSMLQKLPAGTTKFAAAKTAAIDFLGSVAARSGQPYAVPEDVAVIGFNTETKTVATGSDKAAQSAVKAMKSEGNTNVGKALQASLDALRQAPSYAEKRIVFLSDGLTTEGKNEKQIFAGPVKAATKAGIKIDAIAFGKVNQADISFLKKIAKATGGRFYQPGDTYGLRVSFLQARYTSLGLHLVDTDANPAKRASVDLGTVETNTRLLEIGLIADGQTPQVKVLWDGQELAESDLSVTEGSDGMRTIQVNAPQSGVYTLTLDGSAKKAHVFAVKQQELFQKELPPAAATDNSVLFLIGAGAALLLAIILTISAALRSRSRKRQQEVAETGETLGFENQLEPTEIAETAETEERVQTGELLSEGKPE